MFDTKLPDPQRGPFDQYVCPDGVKEIALATDRWGMATITARRELQVKKSVKSGWLLVVASLLIPPFGLAAAYTGLSLRHTEARRVGMVIATVGLANFLVRFGLWLHWTS